MRYRSEILEVIHQDAVEMFKIGGISEERMRHYDEMCLVQEPEPDWEFPEHMEMEHISPVTAGMN